MNVFISHKQEDSAQALTVASVLRQSGHTFYLDVIDENAGRNGDDLGEYLRSRMGDCDSLIAVVSAATKTSWWVPWEIGVATEKNYPLSTYLSDGTEPPDYLRKWPVLRTYSNLRKFASRLALLETRIRGQVRLQKSLGEARRLTIPDFHRELKRAIGQTP